MNPVTNILRRLRALFKGSVLTVEPVRCACGCGHVIEGSDPWVYFPPRGADPSKTWIWLFDHLNRRRGGTLSVPEPAVESKRCAQLEAQLPQHLN